MTNLIPGLIPIELVGVGGAQTFEPPSIDSFKVEAIRGEILVNQTSIMASGLLTVSLGIAVVNVSSVAAAVYNPSVLQDAATPWLWLGHYQWQVSAAGQPDAAPPSLQLPRGTSIHVKTKRIVKRGQALVLFGASSNVGVGIYTIQVQPFLRSLISKVV